MGFEITILGSSSATPTLERHHTAQFFSFKQKAFLIDCGEGTQTQLLRYGLKSSRIEKIYISHLHPDHCLGLTGLLSSLSLKGRNAPVHIYAPKGLEEILEVQFRYCDVHIIYPLKIHELPAEPMAVIFEDDDFIVRSFPVEHRIPCWGFRFDEKRALRSIKKAAVLENPVPYEAYAVLRRGDDFTGPDGKVYSAAYYTIPNKPPVSYAYVTDTRYLPELATQLGPVDLLYHESTFLSDLNHKAENTLHSTAKDAGEFAKLNGAKKLIIGHFSSRYKDLRPLEAEAQKIFPDTSLALEGQTFKVE
jgi:ribonuclease Z